MRILYVTSMWSGLNDLLSGVRESKGMPGFIKPLKHLIDKGHTVDMIIVDAEDERTFSITADWFKKVNILQVIYKNSILKRCFSVKKHTEQTIASNSYQFIYGHGPYGAIANMVANKSRIPFGQRIYGTFMAKNMKDSGDLLGKLKSPLEYLAFVLKKEFLIATNDGTKADYVYNSIKSNKKNISFIFLLMVLIQLMRVPLYSRRKHCHKNICFTPQE